MQRVLVPHHIAHGPPPRGQVHELSGLTMGTSWSVRLVSDNPAAVPLLRAGIQQQLDAVVAQMSHWVPDSHLSRFNRAEAGSWHALPDAFFEVLSYALETAADSDGTYDPAAGALVNLWGFGPVQRYDEPGFAAPSSATIEALAGKAAWRRVALDPSSRRAWQPGDAVLDFSAVAKGYAVDAVARYLESRHIRNFLVEVGGELRGAGVKPDGLPWWVALEQPVQEEGSEPILLALHGLAAATSGDYRRRFEQEGRVYPHTLDPRTGYPIRNGVASVTVIHTECMAADALSTALTVLGVEQGMCFAEARCLAVRFLVRQGDALVEHVSSAFLEMLE